MLGSNPDKLLGWLIRRLLSGAHHGSAESVRIQIENALRTEQVIRLWNQADISTREELTREIEAALGVPITVAPPNIVSRVAVLPRAR